jgi:cytidylate kinase
MLGSLGDDPYDDMDDVVVAIDGPAGSGKSTVARAVADRVQLRHLDTGATYRALTLALLRQGVSPTDPDAVAAAAKSVDLSLELAPGRTGSVRVLLDGAVMGEQLRTPEVNAAVSPVSAVPAVREQLVDLQRAVIGLGGVVAEGRDVGTVVWPQAEVKVFLTADAAERARRRHAPAAGGETAEAVARRDRLDSGRATSPTRAAPDAVVIDSTNRDAGDVVAEIVGLVEAARAGRSR